MIDLIQKLCKEFQFRWNFSKYMYVTTLWIQIVVNFLDMYVIEEQQYPKFVF